MHLCTPYEGKLVDWFVFSGRFLDYKQSLFDQRIKKIKKKIRKQRKGFYLCSPQEKRSTLIRDKKWRIKQDWNRKER